MLDRLVREKAALPGLLDGIGATVARFQAAANTGGETDELGGIKTIRRDWQENFAQTGAVGPELVRDDTRRRVREYVAAFLECEGRAPRGAGRGRAEPRLPWGPAAAARLLRKARADLL